MTTSQMTPRHRRVLTALAALAVALIAGLLATSTVAQAAPAGPPAYLTDQVAACKADQAVAQTSAEITWARRCVTLAQRALDAWYAANPSPSPSTSTGASASPSVNPPSPSVTGITPSPSLSSPSPSPSSSPSPPPGPLLNCATQLAACGYPTTSGVGVPAGTVLTPFTGDYYVMTAGQVVQNMEVNGCIWVHAPGVVITNTRVRMADRCFYGISTYDAQGGLTVIDHVEVVCNYAHGSAVAGPGLRLSRSWLHACENGLEVNANSVVEDSVIAGSEQTPYSNDPHGDGIQSQGGNNVTIRHNTLLQINPVTSAIITNPTANNTWLVENNFLGGGAYTLYCPEQGTGWTVQNNRFVPAKTGGLYSAAYGLTDACGHAGITWTGNYRDNDLSLITPS